MRRRTKQK